VLWVSIQFAFKAPLMAANQGWPGVGLFYLQSFIEPFGTLWFIYLLPIFFVVTKATRSVPPVVVWLIAAALEIAPVATGWTVIDEFAGRFVYFYTGYMLAPHIFRLAAGVQAKPTWAALGLIAWGVVNGVLVAAGYAERPFVSLALGLAGAAAVVSVSALMAKSHLFVPLRYCGRNSIVIYLAFFLPMMMTRTLLIKSGLVPDVGIMSLLVTTAGVIGPLLLWWLVRGTRLGFLFERPPLFWVAPKRLALQPAE
jgi:uncharacterized membrane protein YcfT